MFFPRLYLSPVFDLDSVIVNAITAVEKWPKEHASLQNDPDVFHFKRILAAAQQGLTLEQTLRKSPEASVTPEDLENLATYRAIRGKIGGDKDTKDIEEYMEKGIKATLSLLEQATQPREEILTTSPTRCMPLSQEEEKIAREFMNRLLKPAYEAIIERIALMGNHSQR